MKIDNISSIKTCFLSSFPPRGCGIATFTKDLSSAMDKRFNPKLKSKVIALNENEDSRRYENKVIVQFNKNDLESFIETAKKINESEDIKIISLQHEFGLYGGEYGSYIIPFLETLEKPVVVTFHSVLPDPDPMRKRVVNSIASRCSAIIVMTNVAVDILEREYEIPRDKIHVIHHGVPNVKFKDNFPLKEKLNLVDKSVLLTFGLLSRGKGIEYMIKALPKIVEKHPNSLYLIAGQTHPVVKAEEGEEYRDYLKDLIKDLDLKKHVRFDNRFLSLPELIEYLQAADTYICTNLEKNQITSGTLAYAMSCGRATVSTPSLYAKDVLSDNRGVLAKFKNPDSYSKAIIDILSDKTYRSELEKNAYYYSRQMTWSNVALNYLKMFNKIVKLREEVTEKFPKVILDHMINLTDNFAMIQFSENTMPDKKTGYTLDDSSRALIATALHNNLYDAKESETLAKTYLNFIDYCQEKNGNFKNNHQNEEELTKPYSEDAFGRTMWALGFSVSESKNQEIRAKAKELFENSLKYFDNINSLRAQAFLLMGLCYYYKKYPLSEIIQKIREIADTFCERYDQHVTSDWKWFEPALTYSNAKLPEALFMAYQITKDKRYLGVAEETLNFLSDLMIIDGKLYPIGQNGWYNRNEKRAFFDQQPIDVSAIVQSFLLAYEITKNQDYYDKAVLSFNWFLGQNHLNQMMYDESSGGCYDGLGKHSLNLNQGAESTIAYLMARLFFEKVLREKLR
jgi:glycosyltransferase involved in cell wall biosynthesis